MSLNNLPVRLAAAPAAAASAASCRPHPPPSLSPKSQEKAIASSDANSLPLVGDAAAGQQDSDGGAVFGSLSPEPLPLGGPGAAGAAGVPTNHQFWLKDAKIAEDLFTIHRSAKHLAEFTSAIIGNHDPSLGLQPIAVMSDADVLFMTQLSNDIARSVGGISAVRHHGLRTKKRTTRNGVGHHSSHRRDKSAVAGGPSKRVQVRKAEEEDTVACSKCGRTETPEWRKGPDGLLCNVCGLVYAKQRRKFKSGT